MTQASFRHRVDAAVTRACLVALVLTGASGCSPDAPASPARSASATPPGVAPPAAGDISAADQAFLQLAEQELISRCMSPKGFTYHVVGPSSTEGGSADGAQPGTDRYGSDDVAAAERDGYGLASAAVQPPPTFDAVRDHPNTRYVQSLAPDRQRAYSEALFGQPASALTVNLPNGKVMTVNGTGCVAEVRKRLFGDDLVAYLRVSYLSANIDALTYDRVVVDRRYTDALAVWRGCMQRRGHRYETPGAARDAMAQLAGGSRDTASVRARERDVAVADTGCARESHLVSTANELHATLRERVLADFEGELLAYGEMRTSAVGRARALLGSR